MSGSTHVSFLWLGDEGGGVSMGVGVGNFHVGWGEGGGMSMGVGVGVGSFYVGWGVRVGVRVGVGVWICWCGC